MATKYTAITKIDLTNETGKEFVKEHEQIYEQLTKACIQKDWSKMFLIIDKHVYTINTSLKTGNTPLDYVASSGDVTAMNRLLSYPTCNLNILKHILERNSKLSKEIKATIGWKIQKIKQENMSMPILTENSICNNILHKYTTRTIRANTGVCWELFNPDKCMYFHEIIGYFFHYIGSNTLAKVRTLLNRELRVYRTSLDRENTINEFYSDVINLYTDNGFNHHLARELTNQTTINLGVYFMVLNAVFMYWEDLEKCAGYTYRGVRIGQREIDQYKVGKEFSWLSFMACSNKMIPKNFNGNCWFQIDNSFGCIWSPRYLPYVDEYVYPCGAQFRVTKVELIGVKICIYLKLICTNDNNEALYNNLSEDLERIYENLKDKCPKVLSCQEKYMKESKEIFDLKREIENEKHKIKIDKKEVLLEEGEFAFNCITCKHTCSCTM